MTACVAATFPDNTEARSMRRRLARERRLIAQVYECEKCLKYHLRMVPGIDAEIERQIVSRLAFGLTAAETARDMGMTVRAVEKRIVRMKQRLYATSASNLVALFIAFGEVPLENMLAMVEEKTHA